MTEQKKKNKSVADLLSKTAGLVFFSFLAISLGVVFGLLFEGWVKDQPGTMVGTDGSKLETIKLPLESLPNTTSSTPVSPMTESGGNLANSSAGAAPMVSYKVRVGPYNDREQALTVSTKLKELGYNGFVGTLPPYAVQVGSFGTQSNADKLQQELTKAGYQVFVEKE